MISYMRTVPVLAAVLVSCKGDRGAHKPDDAARAERPRVDRVEAAASIARERCHRDERCNKLGPGHPYADSADCSLNVERELVDEFKSNACEGGVEPKELDECVAAIRGHDCANPFNKLEELAACRESELCRAAPRM